MKANFVYLWTYDVREGCEADFEALYGPDGGWAQLFRRSTQYLGTDLLRDRSRKRRYVSVDRWASGASHRDFASEHPEEIADLDRRGERLTTSEARIGEFDVMGWGD